MIDDLPENLCTPTPPFNHVEAANRATVLLEQCRDADKKGLLSYRRVAVALTSINSDLCVVGADYQAVAGNVRLFILRDTRLGKAVVGPHGTLAQVSAFSSLERSYRVLTDSMKEIEILWETSGNSLVFHTDANGVTTATGKLKA